MVKVGDKELATLSRGKFVGERTLVTGKLRSASCMARTRVTAIVMQKRDFLDVNNPMVDWMIPYDAMRAVLKESPLLSQLATGQLEMLLDRCGPKMEAAEGHELVAIKQPIDAIIVIISGSVTLHDKDGAVRSPLAAFAALPCQHHALASCLSCDTARTTLGAPCALYTCPPLQHTGALPCRRQLLCVHARWMSLGQ